MPTVGVQSHLSIMEAFADLIPGVVLLTGIWASLSTQVVITFMPDQLVIAPLGVVELVLFAIVAIVVGIALQSISQMAEHTFDDLIGQEDVQNADGISYPFRRISMTTRIKNLSSDRSTHLEKGFWRLCQTEFPLLEEPITEKDANQLWKAIHAYLAASPYSLTVRYRALNNMCRGLWGGFGILFIYYLFLVGLAGIVNTPPLEISILFASSIISGGFMITFGYVKNQFKELWFENLLFEFYLAKYEQHGYSNLTKPQGSVTYTVTIEPVAENEETIRQILTPFIRSERRISDLIETGGVVTETDDEDGAEVLAERLREVGAEVAIERRDE